jgi:carboxyl-terminal processing protease
MTYPNDATPPDGPPPDPWSAPPSASWSTSGPAGSGSGPAGATPPGGSWVVPPPASAPSPNPDRTRGPIIVALIVVAILSGSALFASGFTLGLQQALAPGTPVGERNLFDPFWEAYRKITTEYVGQVAPKDLVEGAIGGMFDAVHDPYSSYMTSEEYRSSMGGISGEFEGIGAEMTTETPAGGSCETLGASCALVVVDVIRDSPAEGAGLLPRDRLMAVDGVPVEGSTLDEVVARVKGPRDTEVTLSVLRADQPVELRIMRDVVRTEDVRAEVLAGGTVGYLNIAGFSGSAAEDFRSHLKEQLDAGIRKFVVDVRDDPGGFVDAAQEIASEFIASGPVYWEEYSDGRQVATPASGEGLAIDPSIAVSVLINRGSASASEILAGALQDTGRATLVGEQSFGKGTIQQWHLLSNDTGGFRLSVAKWLTPLKRWIHGTGLTPDVLVPAASSGTGDDPQLDRALRLLAATPAGSPQPIESRAPGASGAPRASVAPGGTVVPEAPASPQAVGWPLRIGILGSPRRYG